MYSDRIKRLTARAQAGVLAAGGSVLAATGKVYVADEGANSYANTVSVIDVAGRKVIATVPIGCGPNGISFAP